MSDRLTLTETVSSLREELREKRQEVRAIHDRQLSGPRVSAKLAAIIDTVIFRLRDVLMDDLGPRESENLASNVSIVALGSYGRRQCAPYSDVDLMILHKTKKEKDIAVSLRPLTQGIFDVGLQLGHSVRTESEALQLAKDDAIICTSLISARFLFGNQQLFDSFFSKFKNMVERNSRSLCNTFLEARTAERDHYGETVYLLEPHVKRSRGGIRDMNLLGWLSFAEHGVYDPDRLYLLGAMSKLDHRRTLLARDYLLRLRNEMHFHAGSAKDLLDRAEQIRIAEWRGHTHRAGLLPVEHFMRDYYRHTNHFWQMIRRREAIKATESVMSRVLEPVLGKNIDGDYRVGMRTVSTTPKGLEKIKSDLNEVLRFLELSISNNKLVEYSDWCALILAAPEFSEGQDEKVNQEFYNLLASSKSPGELLRILHEIGLLEKIIPAVKHARCLLQFNQYHKFTVDEHCIRSVLKVTSFATREDSLGKAYQEIEDKRILHLALLLHDLGKGFEEDHSEVGKRIAFETCELLGLDVKTTEDIALLVHKHLTMSHLTFRRDTSDTNLLKQFAEGIGTVERLRMLFVMTCADLAAVGPDVLNDWKVEVLSDVFQRSSRLLEEEAAITGKSDIEQSRKKIIESLSSHEQGDPWFARQLNAFPVSYLASCDIDELIQTLRAFNKLQPSTAQTWGKIQSKSGTVQFTAGINNGIGRGAFSSMAGTLSSEGLEILSASTDILPDKFMMLRYSVADPQEKIGDAPERLDALCKKMSQAVFSNEPPRFSQIWGQQKAEASTRLTALPIQVRIDNDLSQDFTIIEVFTFDRVGLLYFLARKLHDLELVISHAKIATYLDQVVDVFYVTSRESQKITEESQLDEIRVQLLAIAENK